MKIQLIRNATLKISMAGITLLTDPVLLPRHGIESFAGIEKNPTVELPFPVEDVIKNIDMVLVSHLHRDHFDDGAKKMLPMDIPILCRKVNESALKENGFLNVTPIETKMTWQNIEITPTPGRHAGNEKWETILGRVSGFVFRAPGEPVVYWAGDTILYDEIKTILTSVKPDIIITHSGGAELGDSGPIVMDARQTVEMCKLCPEAVVIAVHMEALDHCKVSRQALRHHARINGILNHRLRIPENGETLNF
ncbi:MAG: MBL fold metallo-hydrolase [Desulfobacula sp.]|jgi:L-ascorbate metabolism protein UlaG (beta-lactamase superfamily)